MRQRESCPELRPEVRKTWRTGAWVVKPKALAAAAIGYAGSSKPCEAALFDDAFQLAQFSRALMRWNRESTDAALMPVRNQISLVPRPCHSSASALSCCCR